MHVRRTFFCELKLLLRDPQAVFEIIIRTTAQILKVAATGKIIDVGFQERALACCLTHSAAAFMAIILW